MFKVENPVVHCWTEIVFQASTDAGNTSFIPDSFVAKTQTQHTERWEGSFQHEDNSRWHFVFCSFVYGLLWFYSTKLVH